MRLIYFPLGLAVVAAMTVLAFGQGKPPHNVIIFVADGLRSQMVSPDTAPVMAGVRSEGVDLANSHAIFPTLTTPNASAIATGHRLGDTGDFGNILYVGGPTSASTPSPFAGVEDDDVLGGLNHLFGGNYLHEASLMSAARRAGFSTAAIGKLGPVAIQDVAERDGRGTLIIDDVTGQPGGLPLPEDVVSAIQAAGLSPVAEDRGLNASPGSYNSRGVWVANVQQQDWFVAVATKVLLPRFRASGRPFLMMFWSRDPDGTQHNQGDSLNTLTPGINGKTSLAGIRNADADLGRLRQSLHDLGLEQSTDIVVAADHGFSTISKRSVSSAAAKLSYLDVPSGFLPPGFLAIDLARALGLPLFDGARLPVDFRAGQHPRTGDALLGAVPSRPEVAIAVNGGSDLLYLPGPQPRALARRIVDWLSREDYTGALFVNDALGPIAGALPFSAIGLKGEALTPEPSIIVSFASASTGCHRPELCAVEVADTPLQQGQGTHGSFSRADTHNFMAATGPDFRRGFSDPAPASNADIAPTLARILGLDLHALGALRGRVLTEMLPGGRVDPSRNRVIRSEPAANGFVTRLDVQQAGGEPYFDAAGDAGRVVGLRR